MISMAPWTNDANGSASRSPKGTLIAALSTGRVGVGVAWLDMIPPPCFAWLVRPRVIALLTSPRFTEVLGHHLQNTLEGTAD